MPAELKVAVVEAMIRTFGSAGMLEADASDNFESMTLFNRGSEIRRGKMSSLMGLGTEIEDPAHPGLVSPSAIGETSYRGFYRAYREILAVREWAEMRVGDTSWKSGLMKR
jgi:hypothetical protein